MCVVFRVKYSRASAHSLYLASTNHGLVAHAVFVPQCAAQWDGHDLHIVMGVHAKTHSSGNDIVIEDPQCAEMYPVGIVLPGKTKGVAGFQPTVVGRKPVVCVVDGRFHTCQFP